MLNRNIKFKKFLLINCKSAEYIIPTKPVTADEVVKGLLDLAENVLKVGGRLVFLYPIDRDKYYF